MKQHLIRELIGKASTNIDIVGLAVFKDDILVGELTAVETICHLIITNRLEKCVISIPNPFNENKIMDLYITLDKGTKNSVSIINGSPYISCNVKLDAKILSSERNSDYFEANNLKIIESYAVSYIKKEIENYLYKTSKDYKSDIAMFGKYAVKSFTTWDKWLEYNWLDNYTNSFFNVNAEVNVISSHLIS